MLTLTQRHSHSHREQRPCVAAPPSRSGEAWQEGHESVLPIEGDYGVYVANVYPP